MSEDLKLTEDGLRSLLHQRTGMQANSRRMNDVIKVFAELMAPNTRPIPLSQARGGEGVWVPKEPTEEMRKAGQVAADDKRHKWIGGYGERDRQSGLDGMSFFVDAAYRAMIAAAPSAGLGADAKRRPEVEAFADLMEAQLRANDHKPGWKADTDLDLYERLGQESAELLTALHRHAKRLSWGDGWVMETDTEQRIGREAADIANFAMMIADVCGALPTAPGLAPPAPDEEGVREAVARLLARQHYGERGMSLPGILNAVESDWPGFEGNADEVIALIRKVEGGEGSSRELALTTGSALEGE